MNTETVYINKTIYDKYGLKVPETWDDIFRAAEVMRGDGVYPLAGVAKAIWLYCVAYAEQTAGKRIFDDNDKIEFSEDDVKMMLEHYVRMVREKVIPKVEDFTKNDIDSGKYAGTVAWVSDAVNYYGSSIERGDEIVAAGYTAYSPDKSGEGWYQKPATLYAVSKNTDHPKESAMLLEFLLNSEEMALLQGIEKGIPISEKAISYLKNADMLNGIQYEASEVMAANPRLAEMSPLMENNEIISSFIDCCDLVLYDKETSDEAAKKFCEDNAVYFG